jgi:sugar transferase (PEP-CTERM system associated)
LLFVLELAAFVSAALLASYWANGCLFLPRPSMVAVALFMPTMAICSTAMGLYSRRQRSRLQGIFLRELVAIGCSVAVISSLTYFIPGLLLPPAVLALGVVIVLILISLTRFGFYQIADEAIFKRRVVVCGAGHRAIAVSQLRRRSDQRGITVVGFLQMLGESVVVPQERIIVLRGSLLDYCMSNSIDELVIAMDDRRRSFPIHELLECRLHGCSVIDLADFLERETGKVKLEALSPSWFIFARGFGGSRSRAFSKRAFDIVASTALLVLAWPLMVITTVAIKFEDGLRASVFYRQRRVGLGGKVFFVVKFRSMEVDAERHGGAQWAQAKDLRITRVGSVIRKLRIDELAQVFNVFRGDMSFVGPRPERPEFVAGLEDRIPYYRERHSIKPGITGWAQLCYPYGSSEHDAAEKLEYDLYYVKNHSLLFDCMILLQTVEVVIWGKGAR